MIIMHSRFSQITLGFENLRTIQILQLHNILLYKMLILKEVFVEKGELVELVYVQIFIWTANRMIEASF